MNYEKRKRMLTLFFPVLLILPFLLFAQGADDGKIVGYISSDAGALIGVNVYLDGPVQLGTATDKDGMYTIDQVPIGAYTLNVTFIGYKTIIEEIVVRSGQTVTKNFILEMDVLDLSSVVVTGVTNPVSKIESSVSISSTDMIETQKFAPRTTAEIFRTLPGIRSEASGGDGNTNITVRGVPISAGGSKFLQLQEDGLPVFQFGDIAFATADIFLRADNTISRIEAIRGGSASTMATNSPAGIINFISKTGIEEGGSVSTTTGLDYESFRTDFEYGSALTNSVRFHIGGFLRSGEGARTAGYTANLGGQIKMNLTKSFDGGYGRIYFKFLNDRAAAYMPIPMNVTGSDDDPTWKSVKGFDAVSGTMHSPYLLQNMGTGPNGGLRRSDVADGMHPVTKAIGMEFKKELGNGWRVDNRGRLAFNSGRFVSPFPAQIGSEQGIAESIGGEGATLKYTNGTAFGDGYKGNNLVLRIHIFDTELNNFNNFVNDFKVSKNLGIANVRLGYFISMQSISMSWLWNSYLTEVNGEDAKLLDVYNAAGENLSQNGLYAYGVPAWGNLHRNYDTKHLTNAPYISADMNINERISVDASVRFDFGHVTGNFAEGTSKEYDVNGDGSISPNETNVAFVNNANPTTVDFDYDYVSFSVGGNYKLTEKQAVFGRYSRGGSAKADRVMFIDFTDPKDPDREQKRPYTDGRDLPIVDMIDQAELGYKHMFKNAGLFITGFMAKTNEEGGYEASTQKIIENDYQAYGVEIEGAYRWNSLNIRGGLTFTSAEITSDGVHPDTSINYVKGNIPRRQPTIMFQILPTYDYGQHSVGLSIIGQTEAYAQDINELKMPAYVYINAFARYQITSNFYASVNANNLFNSVGVTECEEGRIEEYVDDNKKTHPAIEYVRARSIVGRSVSLTLGCNF